VLSEETPPPEKPFWHPKFVERWGKIYVTRYLKNNEEAVRWAMNFFPSELTPIIAEQAKKELAKRGIRTKK
jgi:hypothetical protein